MVDLIERYKITANLPSVLMNYCNRFNSKQLESITEMIYELENSIESADVQPVKHGRWIKVPECLEYEGALDCDYFVCSECHHVWNTIDNCAETFKYCPNCGSKNEDGDSE